MNLFKALQEVPVGRGGEINTKIVVIVIKNDGDTYSMRLCAIDRIHNDIQFRIINQSAPGAPTRNFYWDRGGPDGYGDFLQRCLITSARVSKSVRNSFLEITVRDPGRGAGSRYRR